MDSRSIQLCVALAALLVCSAFFSATETAFSSLSRIRIKNLAEEGNKKAMRVYQLNRRFDELLSTILIGNNLVNIASTSIATVLFIRLLGSNGPTVSTIVMTVLVLVFGEISPKSLAKEWPEDVAMFSAPIIHAMMVALKPVNFLFSRLKQRLMKWVKPGTSRTFTESELLTLVEEAEQEGGIAQEEGELLRNVIEFDDITAEDILTPRVDVVAIQKDTKPEEIVRVFKETGYSRIPVYADSKDYIIGIIHEKNFYRYVWGMQDSIESIIKPVEFIPPTMRLSSLLKLLQRTKMHLAVVVDEFGGTEGIVTLEDVIEELIGDIWDEHDAIVKESFIKQSDGSYLVYCSTDLEDLFEFFNLQVETDSSSISGWVMEHFDALPKEQDSFTVGDLIITVHKLENNRIMEILVKGEPIKSEEYTDNFD